MFLGLSRRFASDTPFRYGSRVKVSPHIRSKDFSKEVLLFASPVKLHQTANAILQTDSEGLKPGAFWEVFAKRTNESMHLLDGQTIARVLECFHEKSDRLDLLSGLCHVVSQDLASSANKRLKYSSVDDLLILMKALNSNLQVVESRAYDTIVHGLAELAYLVESPIQAKDILTQMARMRPHDGAVTPIENILLERLTRILGIVSTVSTSPSDVLRLVDASKR